MQQPQRQPQMHGVENLVHLVTPGTINIIKDIVNFNSSIFDNIDPFHFGLVQNSSLNGMFSSFISAIQY